MNTLSPDSLLTALTDGAAGVLHLVTDLASTNPTLLMVAGAFILLALIIRGVARSRKAPTDPSRLFSANQRAEGFSRAGGRCELEGWGFTRCRRPASHGDHHFPWSKGGSTSMANFVAACAKCNTSKGAKVPGFFVTLRMQTRRRRYFPRGSVVAAGERFTQR
ncbi:MAG TPA: HNH endonuclease [Arthrobacter sp.]